MKMADFRLVTPCSRVEVVKIIKPRKTRYPGLVARMGDLGNSYKILVGNPEGKRTLLRRTCK
jgi:hypothetical protein